jgi:hypothetical protein
MTRSYTSALANLAAKNGILSLVKMMVLMQSDVLPYADNISVRTAGLLLLSKVVREEK